MQSTEEGKPENEPERPEPLRFKLMQGVLVFAELAAVLWFVGRFA